MDRHTTPTHVRAIIEFGRHTHETLSALQRAEPCFRRLDELATKLREMGFNIAAHPPGLHSGAITPYLIATCVDDKLLQAINSTGHRVLPADSQWRIRPPDSANEYALEFRLWEEQ